MCVCVFWFFVKSWKKIANIYIYLFGESCFLAKERQIETRMISSIISIELHDMVNKRFLFLFLESFRKHFLTMITIQYWQ